MHHFKEDNKISSSLKHLCNFDFSDKETHSEVSKISLGFRTDKLLQDFKLKKAIMDKCNFILRQETQIFVLQLLQKLMEKCPINSLIRNAVCMDLKYMVKNSASAESKIAFTVMKNSR